MRTQKNSGFFKFQKMIEIVREIVSICPLYRPNVGKSNFEMKYCAWVLNRKKYITVSELFILICTKHFVDFPFMNLPKKISLQWNWRKTRWIYAMQKVRNIHISHVSYKIIYKCIIFAYSILFFVSRFGEYHQILYLDQGDTYNSCVLNNIFYSNLSRFLPELLIS